MQRFRQLRGVEVVPSVRGLLLRSVARPAASLQSMNSGLVFAMAGVALLAVASALPNPAAAQCAAAGANTIDCIGSFPTGLDLNAVVPSDTNTVNVFDLTSDIGSLGIQWNMGGSTSLIPPTLPKRSLTVDMGDFSVSGAPAVRFQSVATSGFFNPGSAFPLELGFTGDAVGVGPGPAILVSNRGAFNFLSRNGGTVGNIELTLEGSVSGPAGVQALSQGGDGVAGNNSEAGGIGAAGGNVFFDTTGDGVQITTQGDGAIGLLGTSFGGAGGSVIANRGGEDGGRGGDGGSFFFGPRFNDWTIETAGPDAPGIRLESAGGDGGNGGPARSNRGGKGGAGGGAGQIVAGNMTAKITTDGKDSPGLVSFSSGGIGGDGAKGSSGGDGGPGGFGSLAQVNGVFDIETKGGRSDGIAISSVGGVGGQGGDGGFFGSGGSGANSGSTGNVQITLERGSSISTAGNNSVGVSVQAIGGRGGAGGKSVGLFSFGAAGGSGGRAGSVTIDSNSDISTQGNGSTAILTQSIGGGGGNGGGSFGLFYSAGGVGAVGGAGGTIVASSSGSLKTAGNDSSGIVAQSIGGTGGSGGSSGGLVAIGGRGSSAHNAGGVEVSNFGSIETGLGPSKDASASGHACVTGCSYGIVAQSIGGGGGNGGASAGWFSVGGNAGGGGSGGAVTVRNQGLISTQLVDSTAILAQSIGGGGGNGGASVSAGLGAAVAIGGSGGGGGNGGSVTVTMTEGAETTTAGDSSHAVQAQSIGGGGGNGGFAASAAVGPNIPAIALSVGGGGGTGGHANVASIHAEGGTTGGTISTLGDDSNGLFAQSIGGGGGNGGFALALSASNVGTVSLAVGGGSGSGGRGAAAEIMNEHDVTTAGTRSVPILAQSIGGGGGNGGLAVSGNASAGTVGVAIGIGGGGGPGNFAREAEIANSGKVESGGDEAPGIVAQSIGGGGGRGGAAVAATLSLSGSTSVSLGLGGGGGSGGDGSLSAIQNSGAVTTAGNQSQGLFAQSIGGGGGSGGLAITANLSTSQSVRLGASLGGSGAAAGSGGNVVIENTGALSTSGDRSEGIFAQSVGAGGGNGGMAISADVSTNGGTGLNLGLGGGAGTGGNGSTVSVLTNGSITTSGEQSAGIFAQSVGGGGGNGGSAITGNVSLNSTFALGASIGGGGGGSGNGDQVTVTANADVMTSGVLSDGIFAQSIGGGGGNGGTTVTGNVALKGSSTQMGFGLGGTGGVGGAAGAVAVNPNALDVERDITVTGDGSRGIVAQSLGGGGGNGGMVIGGSVAGRTTKNLQVLVGRSGGSGGNSDQVTVSHIGAISTGSAATADEMGLDREYGILAQSIAGGGGDGGMVLSGNANLGERSLNVGVGGSAGSGAQSGDVSVTKLGSIRTHAENSHGILAQSLSGGGGNGGVTAAFSITNEDATDYQVSVGGSGGGSNTAGDVSVRNFADVAVTGVGSLGLVAQSIGGGGGTGGGNHMVSAPGETAANTVSVAVGGSGGAGGASGEARIVNSGAIITGSGGNGSDDVARDDSPGYGIFAQSIASGGGNGGLAMEGDLSTGDDSSLTVAVGGEGAGTDPAGRVIVEHVVGGTVQTFDDGAHAIVAQSIGGGGGAGATAIKGEVTNSSEKGVLVAVGGSGGGGGDSGNVQVTSFGAIATAGDGAKGIVAQAIGGGGGEGGLGIEGSLVSSAEDANGQLAVGIGGSGDEGGRGGTVFVHVGGDIATGILADGTTSSAGKMDGIFAQSIGGGGGSGGAGISGDLTADADSQVATLGVGGGGGGGRGAQSVNVVSQGGAITVAGDGSRGIVAQSIGGAGGDGGIGIDGSIKAGDNLTTAARVDLGIGRVAGPGGSGGEVFVENFAAITTNAGGDSGFSENHAILAQSIAGGGGTGGIGVQGDIESAAQATALTMGIGGVGTRGENADNVIVENMAGAALSVSGEGSAGIFAQSIGGGGGSGNVGIGGEIAAPDNAVAPNLVEFDVGGFSGGGGDGGRAIVSNQASIIARADPGGNAARMHGIIAQSIGGGGGVGSLEVGGDISASDDSRALSLRVGGSGGLGGSGATGTTSGNFRQAGVGVQSFGSIVTEGAGSMGIFAQNIGGGGGNASAEIDGKVDSGAAETIALSIGASDSDGGDGGSVWVQNLGNVTTGNTASRSDASISGAHGVFAQSVGGGGGTGSLTGSLTLGNGGTTRGVAMNLGASGSGGSGGVVKLDNGLIDVHQSFANQVATFNDNSHGLFAQSIGGGGGTSSSIGGIVSQSGGTLWNLALNLGGTDGASGKGGEVALSHSGASLSTFGDGSYGLFAQSVGGGGGAGGDSTSPQATNSSSFAINLGGRDASSGAGGPVTISSVGRGGIRQTISTSGLGSTAVFAQSVGGGGGTGGVGAGSTGTVTVGGSGGAVGDGGTTRVTLTRADVVTALGQSAGVIAQSVGGGGGYAGQVIFGSTATFGSDIDIGSGSNTSGDGGFAFVTLNVSNVATTRNNAPGVFVQSVGGGGGVAGRGQSGATGAFIGSAGGVGKAGAVTVNMNGFSRVTTSGEQSHGIFAQSAGGGANTTSDTVKVSVNVDGEVRATGAGSHGVYAQSSGTDRGRINVQVRNASSLIEGGTASRIGAERGAAIFLKDGVNNSIVNQGTIRSVDGEAGIAIDATQAGSTTVTNSGKITGQILGTSIARVDNEVGGVIKAAEIDADLVVNKGFLDLGPDDRVGTTFVLGNIRQTSLGVIEVDLDPSKSAAEEQIDDQLRVDGLADLDGSLDVNLLNVFQADVGEEIVPVIIAEDGLFFAGTPAPQVAGRIVEELEVTQSAVAQYRLIQTDPNTVSLAFNIDFANAGILASGNDNQDSVAGAVQSLYRARGLDEDAARSLIEFEEASEVTAAYGTLSAEVAVDTQISALNSLREFNDDLLSCANTGGQDASYRFFDDGQCGFLQVEGGRFNRDATSDNLGFDVTNFSVTLGGQVAVDEVWNIGSAFRYGFSNLNADAAAASSDGDEFFFGLSAKRRFDAIEISTSGGFGYGSFDIERNPFGGGDASADQNLWSLSGQVRAAYLYEYDNLFVKPRIGVGVDHFFSSSYRETGSSAFLLAVDADAETYVNVQPAVELGGEFSVSDETRLRPHLTLGITQYLGDPTASASASFLAGGTPFTNATEIDRTRYDIAAGVDVFSGLGATVRVAGATSLSRNSQDYGGSLRVEIPF